jgi:putative DNA primase/helicase
MASDIRDPVFAARMLAEIEEREAMKRAKRSEQHQVIENRAQVVQLGNVRERAQPKHKWSEAECKPDDNTDAAPSGTDDEAGTTNLSPHIVVRAGDRHLAANAGIHALVNAKVAFYQRDKKLVRVALINAKDSIGEVFQVPGIVPVRAAILDRKLGQSAKWLHFDGRSKKDVPIDLPKQVTQQIIEMVGEWPFAPLNGIIQCPTLRRDGTILDIEGYDDATALFLVKNLKMPVIPDRPTRKDAEAALALLNELLVEFPFVDQASRAVALSMFLTTVLRCGMTTSPMHLLTAPTPGSGKSYLVNTTAMISTGNVCPVKSMSPSAEETEKRLVGAALAGHPIICLGVSVRRCRTV